MEQEACKERKSAKCLTSKRFHSFGYFVAILSMLSCIFVLFLSLVSMQRRLSSVESKLSEISEELKDPNIRQLKPTKKITVFNRRKQTLAAKPPNNLSVLKRSDSELAATFRNSVLA